ncbi:MAG: type II toxin-antitoxin system PemK/MazF family toxin [Deferrisomatales bacterium]
MRVRQGNIVLVPVPFTDLSSFKRRPVVVVSNDNHLRTTPDMVVVALTSNPAPAPYSFAIDSVDLTEGRLNRPSTVLADKVFALSQELAVQVFGTVGEPVLDRVRATLANLLARTS